MKINGYTNSPIINAKSRDSLQNQATKSNASPKKFDAITINTPSRNTKETSFIEATSLEVKAAVRKGTPQSKLDELREKINNGTYAVDTKKLASKILLQLEDSNIE